MGLSTASAQLNPEGTALLRTSSESTLASQDSPYDLPTSSKVYILAGTFSAGALGAVDSTIVASISSSISSSFNASNETSWLGTAYLLSSIAFTPLYGRLCDTFGRRASNATAILIFGIGNLMCCIAPTFAWFVTARFIAGIGGGGMLTTSSIIASDLFPLRSRGLVQAISGLTWSVGSATGGFIGGVINDKFGWRSAFGFQVPLLVLCGISGLSKITYTYQNQKQETFRKRVARIDFLGPLMLLCCFGSILALLSFTSNQGRSIGDARVLASVVSSTVFGVSFIIVEAWVVAEPVLAFRLLRNRTALCSCLVATFIAICNFMVMYHLPLFFITVKGTTAAEAGAHLMPTSFGQVIGSAVGGFVLNRTGRYWRLSLLVGILPVCAMAILGRMDARTSEFVSWVCVLPQAFGYGFILNTSFVALMLVHPGEIAATTGILWLFRATGQLAGVGISSALFQSTLSQELHKRISDPELVQAIRTNINTLSQLPVDVEKLARLAFAVSLKRVFLFGLVVSVVVWLCVAFTEDRSVEHAELDTKLTHDEEAL